MKNKGLGRGLRALIPTEPEGAGEGAEIVELPLDRIKPGAFQARKDFDQQALDELSLSIKEHGVMQPVVVRPSGENTYELIIGERRWRASQIAGLAAIPCVIRDVDDRVSSEMMLVENIQREDFNPIEEAVAYSRLKDEFHLTQEEISARVGKSRPAVANSLRLLQLPEKVRELLAQRKLSIGHGKVLLGLPDRRQQEQLALLAAEKGLTVRDAERAAQQLLQEKEDRPQPTKKKNDLEMADTEDRLRRLLGTKVKIKKGRKGGRIEIDFYSREELDRLLELLLYCGG